MKNKMKLVCIAALSALMFLGNFVPASAATLTNEFEYLRDAFKTIDSVPSEERNQYAEDNREWLDEVGMKLDAYLDTFPEEERNDVIKALLSDNSEVQLLSLTGNLGEYFTEVWSHFRDGYFTYSMFPKWSVRLFLPTLQAAWAELGKTYSGIRNDNGTLWRQYKCHFDYDVFGALAGSWDIEEGRPIVSEPVMVWNRCNPE